MRQNWNPQIASAVYTLMSRYRRLAAGRYVSHMQFKLITDLKHSERSRLDEAGIFLSPSFTPVSG